MIAQQRPTQTLRFGSLLTAFAAVLGHLPVLGAWWNRDDWGLLARASGLIEADGPARLLSQDWYWRALWPVFGLDPTPWAVTRLLMHAGVAMLTYRLASRRLDFGPGPSLIVGLLVAWSPLAFTPLHWASGVQELLGLVLALAALDRIFAGGRCLVSGTILGVAAILSKENALALPILVLGLTALGAFDHRGRRGPLVVGVILLVAAIAESWLVLQHFAHSDGLPYDIGSLVSIPINLCQYGWWLMSAAWPWPTAHWMTVTGLAGLLFWSGWTFFVWKRWQRGDRRAAVLLAAALLSLAPALVLNTHLYPYLALAAWVPFMLTIGLVLEQRRSDITQRFAIGLTIMIVLAGWAGTTARIKMRNSEGLPLDSSVRGAALAYAGMDIFTGIPVPAPDGMIIVQPDVLRGEPIRPTDWYGALAGTLGPRVALPDGPKVQWRSDLETLPRECIVLADGGKALVFWGQPTQARLILSLVRIGQGRHNEALDLILRTLVYADETVPIMLQQAMLTVPPEDVRARVSGFLATVDSSGLPDAQIAGVRQAALDLLRQLDLLPPDFTP